jgi:hypothetical protein
LLGFSHRSTPGPKLGHCRSPGAGGPGYPGIQNTDSSPREPGPQTRPLEGAKGQGPPEAAGPPNDTRQHARSEDHMKMQRPRTCGASAADETKRWATQQSPRRQIAMMAHRFTAGHFANTPIPALRHDASTSAAPLNVASSTPSALHLLPPVLLPPQTPSSSHGSFCLLRHRWICELVGEMPRAPPRQQEQNKGSSHVDARSWRPPAHRGADAGCGEPRCCGMVLM